MHRAGMLEATKEGSGGKRLLLIAHLDTVFPPNSLFQQFTSQGNVAKGPGVTDDKGGLVTLLYALKALNEVHALDTITLRIAILGDEEDSGKPTAISRQALKTLATQSDIALDFENATNTSSATVARRGIVHWTLTVNSPSMHSSQIFSSRAGFGAIFELARILNAFRSTLDHEKYLTFNPGIILGGSALSYNTNTSEGTAQGKFNVIPTTALARGDLRYMTENQLQAAIKKMQIITLQHLPLTTTTLTFDEGIPPMPVTDANLKLLNRYSQASQDLGLGTITAVDPSERGAGDISHIAALMEANLAGLGPSGTGTHTEQETLDLHSLTINTERAAILIYRLTHPE